LKLLPPDKGGEVEGGGERREGEGKEMKGKEGKRTSERSHGSKFTTTPLIPACSLAAENRGQMLHF